MRWKLWRAIVNRQSLPAQAGSTDNNLDEELRFHLEQQIAQNIAAGMSPEAARYAALRALGGEEQIKEECRDARGGRFLEELAQDVRYGLRILARSPGFTAVAVLTLALGIGANTAIFSFVDALLLRPLPFPDSERLVSLCSRSPRESSPSYSSFSYPDYVYYRNHSTTLAGVAAFTDIDAVFRFGDQQVKIPGEMVSSNYFPVLGASPARGRWFLPEEDAAPGRDTVVVLGYGLWQRAFGSDPGVVGRRVVMNGASFTVVGIAPRSFAGLRLDRTAKPEFWVPTMMYPVAFPEMAGWDLQHYEGDQWLEGLARLKPGVTLAQADAEFSTLTEQLKQTQWPEELKREGDLMQELGVLVPANDARINPGSQKAVRSFLGMLIAVVGLVLLIACANVASLMLSRAVQRRSEMGVRLALGAGKGRLFRQLLTESLLVTFMGGIAGLMLAMVSARFFASFHQPFKMPLVLEPRLDLHVLAYSFALVCLTGVLFGVIPLRQSTRLDLVPVLKGASGFQAGRLRFGMQQILVAVQVTFSMVLLVGAVLFVRTLRNAQAADVTRDPGHVLLLNVDLYQRKYDERHGKQFYTDLLARVHSLPGVRSAALVLVVPLGGRRGGNNITVHPGDKPVQVDFNSVSDEYFRTVGLPLVRGRGFNSGDREGAPSVAIINEQMAQRFWPEEDPIGKQIGLGYPTRMAEIIGIVRDGRFRNYRAPVNPCYYVPWAQDMYWGGMNLEVRAAGDPMQLAGPVRREIQALDKDLLVTQFWTLKSFRDAGLGQERLSAALLSGFGILAVVLAAIGLYGVLAFSVARRTHEIGLRMALGARRGDVLKLVAAQGMGLALVGGTVGLACALALTRFVSSLLFGVTPTDPLTFAAVFASVGAVALLACYIPARRASKVDPMVALRYE
jgi:predicted permease